MDDTAKGIIGLTTSLKRAREDIMPLRDQLIEEMQSKDVTSITVGDKSIQLVSKKSRPAVGIKKVMVLVKDVCGAEAALKLQSAIDKSRKPSKISHTIKIVDAE